MKFILIVTVAFALVMSGCQNMMDADGNLIKKEVTKVRIDKDKQSQKNYYPNTVGSYWKYIVKNLDNGYTDELLVKIIGEKILPNGINAAVWTYSFRDSVHRNSEKYVRVMNDTVYEWPYYFNNCQIEMRSYVIPFNTGLGWATGRSYWIPATQQGIDTCFTQSVGDVIVPAGNFNDAYNITRQTWTPFYGFYNCANESYYFVPKIGMIKCISRDYASFINSTSQDNAIEEWVLLEYFINE